jgi:hypothetical protein
MPVWVGLWNQRAGAMHVRRLRNSRHIGLAPALPGRRSGSRLSRQNALRLPARLQLEQLEPRLVLAGVVINEFMALNANGIMDQDGQRADWIELRNTDSTPVNIGGWYLADSVDQWQFPDITLGSGQHQLVFASGKNRAVAGQELHTNFQLSGEGESLKLLMPDGVTVVHAFDPYPAQVDNVSYGLSLGLANVEPLVDETMDAWAHVPTDDSVDATWTQTGFDHSGWLEGQTAVGFERSPGSSPDYTSYFEMDLNLLMPAAEARDTAYLRIPFETTNVSALQNLELLMRYDDGFVAYLNGQEIARRNLTGSPAWNSQATGSHSDDLAIVYEKIDVTAHLDKLVDGSNVLAVHGLNNASNRSDFLIGPMLVTERAGEPVAGYMVTPSPGSVNQEGTMGFVADTKFSKDRGFYDAPFNVEITTATADAVIRYTTDGSAPTATTGLVYNPASPPLITTTTTLRAAAFKAGFTPTSVDTQTYIFLNDVIHQTGAGLPPYAPWSHFGTADWEVDPNIVNHPLYSGTIKNDLQSVSTVSLVLPWNDWFGAGGQGIYIQGYSVERLGSFELFNSTGSENFESVAIAEIQGGGIGGTSAQRWKTDKLSIQVTFKPPAPTRLDAPVFTNPNFDAGAGTTFDTLILDAVLNYAWTHGTDANQRNNAKYIQDQVVADLHNRMGGHSPHGRYVHLYLNGLYWGMYYLHERPDERFAETYLGGNKEDYDVVRHNATTVVNGDTTAAANFAAMLNAVKQNLLVPANYAAVEQWLDIDDFIDYMIVNQYAGNTDWSHKNWYASFNRVDPNGRWRFHSWDAEHVFKVVSDNVTGDNDANSPTQIHQLLIVNPEYRLRFADRVQKHFQNGGTLTPAAAGAVYAARAMEIDRAIVGESARWGDNRREPAYTRVDWRAIQDNLLATYFPNRSNAVLNQFTTRGWLMPVAAPLFSQFGGVINPGFQLTLSKPSGSPASGQIYYTLDGSDPRDAITKQPRASAILYTGPIMLNGGARVSARIYVSSNPGTDTDWSPIVEATFLPQTPFPVRITEVHYNPAPRNGVFDEQDMEFIELFNTGSQAVSLAGVQITQFADPYAFGSGISLGPGERIVVARNPTVFQSVYGAGVNVAPTGFGMQNLSNSGERIALLGPLGETLQDFVYDDIAPWPTTPDGDGPSLEIIDPLGDPNDPANWRASTAMGGSPGTTAVTLTGDYDRNATVDDADRMFWRANFGLAVPPGTGADGTGDGMVDTADYVVWRKAMMSSGMAAGVATSAVVTLPQSGSAEAVDGNSPGAVTAIAPLPGPNPARSASQAAADERNATSLAVGPNLLLALLDQAAVDDALEEEDSPPVDSATAGSGALDDSLDDSVAESLAIWEDEAWLGSLATLG